jgi:hypothetical protein
MEANLKQDKITHRLHTIVQFNDKAIESLKWNKQTNKRQRIKVRFKNGPRGVTLRWTPKTNKKVFELIYIFRGKTYRHDCGEFTPGVYTCVSLQEYLVKLNSKHRSPDGTYHTNPNTEVITKAITIKNIKRSNRINL